VRKIVTIVGARPQFIKAAAFSRAWRSRPGCSECLIHTGQHYDENMSDVFFRELSIPTPEITLGVGSGSHGVQTGRMLAAIEEVLQAERPDALLVYGDTNSTLAGALAAAKLQVPVAHIEAGLRSFNRAMPEETNRVLTDHVSDWLLAPTETAVANLRREGLDGRHVHHVGDVMYDIALLAAPLADRLATFPAALGLRPREYLLVTVHRAENTDDPRRLRTVFTALEEAGRRWPVVMPVHPRTRKALATLDLIPKKVQLLDPVGYLDMLNLTRGARMVMTDSGGLQKEAYFHRVPCLTLREETEWTELVEAGWNQLLSPAVALKDLCEGMLLAIDEKEHNRPTWRPLYGEGHAAVLCADLLQTAER
jgi:UDP-GlcNAc3NAcA epimerase